MYTLDVLNLRLIDIRRGKSINTGFQELFPTDPFSRTFTLQFRNNQEPNLPEGNSFEVHHFKKLINSLVTPLSAC